MAGYKGRSTLTGTGLFLTSSQVSSMENSREFSYLFQWAFSPGNIIPFTYITIKVLFNTKKKDIKLQGNIREIIKYSRWRKNFPFSPFIDMLQAPQ